MITYIKGDILKSPCRVITNPINCVGVMGSGLALKFKNTYPDMYKDYKVRCLNNKVNIGKPYLWESDSKQILNFPTKIHWMERSSLNYIPAGLKHLSENYDKIGIQSIAIPALGFGLGGLNYQDVKILIEKNLSHHLTLDVYEPLGEP